MLSIYLSSNTILLFRFVNESHISLLSLFPRHLQMIICSAEQTRISKLEYVCLCGGVWQFAVPDFLLAIDSVIAAV